MNQNTYETKKNFITHSLSRCVTDMYPRVCRVEYSIHADGASGLEEVAIIRCEGGYSRRVDITGLDLRETADAVLAEFNEAA